MNITIFETQCGSNKFTPARLHRQSPAAVTGGTVVDNDTFCLTKAGLCKPKEPSCNYSPTLL